MPGISRLEFRNIQALRDVSLDLGDITVIVGHSDAGKSTVVRGLQAMLENAFDQKKYMRFGCKTAEVAAICEGRRVGFHKGQTNYYFADGHPRFHKVGREVPVPIRDILGLQRIKFDKDLAYFLAIQTQHQAEFLIHDHGGIASKVIGKLSNLGLVFIARRKALAEQKKARQGAEDAKLKIAGFTKELDAAKLAQDRLTGGYDFVSRIDQLDTLEKAVSNLSTLLSFSTLKSKLQPAALFSDISNNIDRLEKALTDITKVSLYIQNQQHFERLNSSVNTSDLSGIPSTIQKMEDCLNQVSLIDAYISSVIKETELVREQEALNLQANIIKTDLGAAVQALDVCPTCDQQVSQEAKERLKS
jgi:prepilin-type processing-associated H-X9-DG protein